MSNILSIVELFLLINQCAPEVHPRTMAAIVEAESSRGTLHININKGEQLKKQPETIEDAQKIVVELLASKANFDVGLAQINSSNFQKLGLDASNVFDPCTNIQAGSSILTENFKRASQNISEEQEALLAALSAYNTGNHKLGLQNGYVERVKAKATKIVVPDILQEQSQVQDKPEEKKPNIPSWNVFNKNDDTKDVFVSKKNNVLIWSK